MVLERKKKKKNKYILMFYSLWEILSQVPLLDSLYFIIGFKSSTSSFSICLVRTEWIVVLLCYFHFLLHNTNHQNLHHILIQEGICNITVLYFLHS